MAKGAAVVTTMVRNTRTGSRSACRCQLPGLAGETAHPNPGAKGSSLRPVAAGRCGPGRAAARIRRRGPWHLYRHCLGRGGRGQRVRHRAGLGGAGVAAVEIRRCSWKRIRCQWPPCTLLRCRTSSIQIVRRMSSTANKTRQWPSRSRETPGRPITGFTPGGRGFSARSFTTSAMRFFSRLVERAEMLACLLAPGDPVVHACFSLELLPRNPGAGLGA